LMDNEMIRAPMMANWIYQIGYDVVVVNGGIDAMRHVMVPNLPSFEARPVAPILAREVTALRADGARLVDLRSPRTYRASHIDCAEWSIRSRLERLGLAIDRPVILVTNDFTIVSLAAQRLEELGIVDVRWLSGDETAWRAVGLQIVAAPDDEIKDSIELVYHWQHRNNPNGGDPAAAHAYLEWEIGLVDQLDDQERGSFRLSPL